MAACLRCESVRLVGDPFAPSRSPSRLIPRPEIAAAQDARGTAATPWSPDVAVANFSRFVQVEITTFAGLSGGVSSLDTLVLPIR